MYWPVLRCHHASESASSVEKRPSRNSAARPRSAAGALEFEDHIQRHDEFGIFRAEDRGLRHAFRSAVITFAGARIDDPDTGNAEGKIVVYALLHSRHAVFTGQH